MVTFLYTYCLEELKPKYLLLTEENDNLSIHY